MRKLSLMLALLLAVAAAAQTAHGQMLQAIVGSSSTPQPCSAKKPDPVKEKKPSPPGCTDAKFADGKMLTIEYSRPKINDPKTGEVRVVWGKLVPWGKEWRMGANEATSFTTDSNLTVGGTAVPAGSYTLYLQPEESGAWMLIISKKTGQWGIPYPGAQDDFARIGMKTSKLNSTVPQFTISFDKGTGAATALVLEWENTRASIDIKEAK